MSVGIDNDLPLFIDLDGTLIKSDMLHESFLVAFKKNPFILICCILWLLKGRSYLKYKLSQKAEITYSLLPLNTEFYTFLLNEKEKNRKIILASACAEKYAKEICRYFKIFDSYISSDKNINLKGENKLTRIKAMSDKFAYAGNSCADYPIFEQSTVNYLVNPTKKTLPKLSKIHFHGIFDKHNKKFKIWLKQLRIHQWLKNLLIFVPLFVSGEYVNLKFIALSIFGFISFSWLASATYIINDLFDLESDRSNESKKNRPLAAGSLSVISASIAAVILFIFAFILAKFVGDSFLYILIVYLFITLSYSFTLKQIMGIDIITLASLYTLRIFAGAAILNLAVSFWLLSFSMFIFFSLALVKRCAELKNLEKHNKVSSKGRDYSERDYNTLMSLGTASALLSVVMFAFYTNSDVLTNQYHHPSILWLVIPALGYWLTRMWVKTSRGEMYDDPITFAMKDRGSLITIGFMLIITLLGQIF